MKKSPLNTLILAGIFTTVPLTLSGCAALVVGAAGAGAGAVIASDSRTVENMANDETIEKDATEVLHSNKILSDSEVFRVNAYSMSGNVLLAGQTTNTDYLKWCESQIAQLDYVRKVFNYVEIRKPVPASQVAADSYLTSQIKANLLFSDGIRSGRFKVVTENSIVYLMGLVMEDEAKRAVNQVLTYDSARKVVTIFDYITDQPNLKETGYTTTDRIRIEKVNGSTSYPQQNSSSTYVAPVSNDLNGGAMIVEDTDLLAPASALEVSD